jgi:dihydroorotate dehydrogenase
MHAQVDVHATLHRLKTNRTDAQVARAVGVSEKTISKWLKQPPEFFVRLRPDNVAKIQQAALNLGVTTVQVPLVLPRLWHPTDSFQENINRILPPPPAASPRGVATSSFLGFPIHSPFGASASVLTSTASLIGWLAQTGADVITFKTVRSESNDGHGTPNIRYCRKELGVLDPDEKWASPLVVDDAVNEVRPSYGMLNRFGMPSASYEEWKAKFSASAAALTNGQLLILSVVGTADKDAPEQVLIDDFVRVAIRAKEAGAKVIELNLSCPNCAGKEGACYRNQPLAMNICRAVREALPGMKILAKVGFMKRVEMERFVASTADYVDGYSLINTIPFDSVRMGPHGLEPGFGKANTKAGLSGPAIFRCGLRAVEDMVEIRKSNGLEDSHVVVGMGGAVSPQDILTYLSAGADVAQATTAFFLDPLFGLKVRELFEAEYARKHGRAHMESVAAISNILRAQADLREEYPADPAFSQMLNEVSAGLIVEWQQRHAAAINAGGLRRSAGALPVDEAKSRMRDAIRQRTLSL